jgi:hypothetical protein
VDDPDLHALRTFRIEEATPPAGLQARIEEQLWQAILAEESQHAGPCRRTAHGSWLARFLRPAVAPGAAAALAVAVAVASDGGPGLSTSASSGVTSAGTGLLDSTASSIFGGSATASSSSPRPAVGGTIDLRSPDAADGVLAAGPDQASTDELREITRDPAELLASMRRSVAQASGPDPTDRVAFRLAMSWVVAQSAPVDLRAAVLRSMDGMQGIDDALVGVDILGRQGIVLSHLDAESGVREQFVLTATGAHLLEQRAFTTGYVDPACPPGTFTEHVLYGDDGTPIAPDDAPWLDWPLVVPACAPGS